ncbi:MAG: hypothetical protein OSJ27_08570 [Candidatus Gastranaerophilales bacterium]|nr:hypothetical protein [Candidatus Gastranaerophilales bacterium]
MSKTIGVVLSLKDKCSPAIVQVAQKFGMAEAQAKKLNAELRQQAKVVDGALKTAVQGATVVIGAAVGVVAALSTKTMEVGDNIDKMSQKIGMSRKAYQEWDYVMSQNGGSVESLKMGYKTLATQMEMVIKGNKDSISYFKKLGVSVKDSTGNLKSQDEVFNDTIKALQNIQNPTERAIIGQKLLGKSFLEMKPLLNQSAESIDALKQKANDLGLVMSDDAIDGAVKLTDTMDTLQRAFGAIGLIAGSEFIPIIQSLADELINNLPQIKTALIPVIESFASAIGFVCSHLDVIIPAVGALAGAFAGLQIISGIAGFVMAFCNPVGLAVVAIGGLIAAIGVARAKGIGFFEALKVIFNTIKGGIGVVTKFAGAILGLGNAFKSSKNANAPNATFSVAPEDTGSANKTPLNKHALGTAFASGGPSLVGEYGPEIVNLPKGANVTPANKTQEILTNSGTNIEINLNVSGNVLGNREFFNEMMNLMAIEIRKVLPA